MQQGYVGGRVGVDGDYERRAVALELEDRRSRALAVCVFLFLLGESVDGRTDGFFSHSISLSCREIKE